MKKFLVIFLSLFLIQLNAFADEYDDLYNSAQIFPSKLYNDIDPYENEDAIKYAYSPYPLFRTSAYLYFKDYTIDPGYYILTPRTLQGKDYLFFKQNGKVQFIIPVAKKEQTPLNFYDANVPKMKLTKFQKISQNIKTKFYEKAQNSMKSPPPSSLVNVDVDVKYIILTLYYGEDKYVVLFKRTPY
jgi:hypothetical protein